MTSIVKQKGEKIMFDKKGITLSEIIAILAIIGLIATIIIVTFMKAN